MHYGNTSAASDDQFDDVDTDDDAQLSQAEGDQEDIVPGETDTSPSTPEDSGDDEIASITSPQAPPNVLNDTTPKMVLPPQTWKMVLHSQPQTQNPEVITLSLNAVQIQDTPMDDPTDRQSDASSETTSSISAHIMEAYEGELPMDNIAEWVKWRAPQLAVPPWMREEL